MFPDPGGILITATISKCTESSYKLSYLITAVLFFWFVLFLLITNVYLYRPRFICSGHIMSYLARNVLPVIPVITVLHSFIMVMDIICIDIIKSYLSCNLHPIFHISSSSVNAWCIIYFPACDFICVFSFSSSFRLVCFVG